MPQNLTLIAIPPGLSFSDLRLARDPDGDVSFDWLPIERICEASGLQPDVLRTQPEDAVSALIVAWYQAHRRGGGGGRKGRADRQISPAGITAQLYALAERQETAAEELVELWDELGCPDEIEIGLASDDHEARALGWPCPGAHAAVIRRVWEQLPPDARDATEG